MDRVLIVSDCKQLVDAMNSNEPPMNLDWRLYLQIIQLWLFFRDRDGVKCVFTGRDNNGEAQRLANWARIRRVSVKEYSYSLEITMARPID
jgi:Reverse transcriptase-like